MRRLSIPLLALTLLAPFGAALGADTVAVGQVMKATADLTLRSAPPSGILNTSGDAIGVVKQGSSVVVMDKKTVGNLFGSYKYYKVQVKDSSGKTTATGWTYGGQVGSESYLK